MHKSMLLLTFLPPCSALILGQTNQMRAGQPPKYLQIIVEEVGRAAQAAEIARLIRSSGPYRWTGLYDVDIDAGLVSNIAWSGPSGPEFPIFPITKGLTSRAIATKGTVNVGSVTEDPDYLTALATTQSEIIVPIVSDDEVVGTLDIESEAPHAFHPERQAHIERYASLIADLWKKL